MKGLLPGKPLITSLEGAGLSTAGGLHYLLYEVEEPFLKLQP